jgi:hypothetical protein
VEVPEVPVFSPREVVVPEVAVSGVFSPLEEAVSEEVLLGM